jgi:hypothetical protein
MKQAVPFVFTTDKNSRLHRSRALESEGDAFSKKENVSKERLNAQALHTATHK